MRARVHANAAGLLAPWPIESEALATIADLLFALVKVTVAAYGKKGAADRLGEFQFPRPTPERMNPTPVPAPKRDGLRVLDAMLFGPRRGGDGHG
jgi:hypothetical protein